MLPGDALARVATGRLAAHCNPYRALVWPIGTPITRAEVRLFVRAGLLRPPGAARGSRNDHIARVAWFVANRCADPIDIDAGLPQLGQFSRWLIIDGNHRFAAALFRGDATIAARIRGSISYARLLGLLGHEGTTA